MKKKAGVKKHIHDVCVFENDKQGTRCINKSSAESKYKFLFTNALNGIVFYEIITAEDGTPVDCRFIEVNSAFERMTGLKADAVIGKTVLEVFPGIEHDPVDWIGRYGKVAFHGETFRFEEYSEFFGKWYNIVAFRTEARRFCMILDDITERKRIEERERLEQRKTAFANHVLRAFVEHEGDALFDNVLAIVQEEMASRHGVFGYIGKPGHLTCPSLSKMLDVCEIEGKCIHYPPEKWKGLWARALTEKRSLYTNNPPPVPPGHPIIRNNLATPILFHGEAIGLLNIANKEGGYTDADRDTLDLLSDRVAPVLYAWIQRKLREDERKRAEEALRESETRMRRIAQTGRIGFVEWNASKDTAYWSPEYYELFGFEQGSPVSWKRWLEGVHPDDRERVVANAARLLERCRSKEQVRGHKDEYRYIRADGSVIWLESDMAVDLVGGDLMISGSVRDITERKRAEERLRRSEKSFALLAEIANELLQSPEPQKLIELLCRGVMEFLDCQTFFNFLVEERAGTLHLNAYAGIPSDEADKIEWLDFGVAVCGCVAQQGCRIVAEHIPTTQDPRTVLIRAFGMKAYACHPLLGEGGRVIGTISFGTKSRETFSEDDLSLMKAVADQVAVALNRVSHEQALRRSEEQFRLALEEAPIPVIMLAEDGQILQISGTWTELTGYRAEEMKTLDAWLNTAYGEGADLVHEHVRSLFKGNKRTIGVELTVRSREGIERYWSFSASSPGTLHDGRRFIVGMALDITERKRMEEAVVAAHRQIQSIIDNTTSIVYAFDLEERFILANTTLSELLNSTPEQMIGKKRHEFMPKEDADWHEANDSRVIAAGRALEFEEHSRLKDRSITWLTTKFPLRDAQGRIYAVAGISADITKRKLAEEELQLRTEELAAANRELESFSYSVSHDLRAPLRSIKGFSGILLEDYKDTLDEQGKDLLGRIVNNVGKMSQLIDDLLRLSKISRQEITIQAIDLSVIAHSIINELRQAEPERNVTVVIAEDLTTRGDEGLLRIALQNLLGNAWKYTGKTPHGRIEFGAFEKDGETVFFIKDNGAGFDMHYADKLFIPFKRLHPDNQFSGVGIGLAIVQRIIQRHGGRIWAESEVGRSTTFYFTLSIYTREGRGVGKR